mmetsp:Transcript_69667/g.203907  ORF Transcript_69667/g.203907 Transcript_69667/m.203907 type:complete len:273 (+) Transcript_69667:59-877(+)
MCFFQVLALATAAVAWAVSDDLALLNDPDSPVMPAAMARDDECLVPATATDSSGQARCALSALQQRHQSVALSLMNDSQSEHPFISGCSDQAEGQQCPHGLVCVAKPDGTWSQCVDCSRHGFPKDCILMNEEMREIARGLCGRSCPYTTPKPTISGCNETASGRCPGHLKCARTADDSWSQCMDCSKRHFYKDCQKLDHDFRLAAIRTCKRSCLDSQCFGPQWCHRPYKCVGDSKWAQCVRCDAKTFRYHCQHWDRRFKHRAERHCRRHCTR